MPRKITPLYAMLRDEAKKLDETNDCAVRAIAAACGITYDAAHLAAANRGRKHRQGMHDHAIKNVVMTHGLAYTRVHMAEWKMWGTTVRTVEKELQAQGGRWLIYVRGHVLAVVDGQTADWAAERQHRVRQVILIETQDEVNLKKVENTMKTKEMLDELNALRKQNGEKPLKAWKQSQQKLAEKISSYAPAEPVEPAQPAAPVKPPVTPRESLGHGTSIAAAVRPFIKKGLTNEEVLLAVEVHYPGLIDKSRRWYVAWYRGQMRRQGLLDENGNPVYAVK